MTRITVETAGFLRGLFGRPVGTSEVLVLSVPEGTTVEGLVRLLAEGSPAFAAIAYEEGQLAAAFQIVIGDRLLELAGGWERVLVENDTVVLLPPSEGG
jgi:molybdopterin converting factor small subunit